MFAFNNRWVTIVKHIMVCFHNSNPLSANGVFQKATEKVKTAVKLGSSTQQTKPLVDIAGYGVSVCNSLVCLVSCNKTTTTCSAIVCLCLWELSNTNIWFISDFSSKNVLVLGCVNSLLFVFLFCVCSVFQSFLCYFWDWFPLLMLFISVFAS